MMLSSFFDRTIQPSGRPNRIVTVGIIDDQSIWHHFYLVITLCNQYLHQSIKITPKKEQKSNGAIQLIHFQICLEILEIYFGRSSLDIILIS